MPNFENLQNTLLNKKSTYIPMIELGIDPTIKEKILGRPIIHPKDDIDFMLQAGYDFVKIQPEIVINLNRQVLQNSAQEIKKKYGGLIKETATTISELLPPDKNRR